jgi:hypothetical protein
MKLLYLPEIQIFTKKMTHLARSVITIMTSVLDRHKNNHFKTGYLPQR